MHILLILLILLQVKPSPTPTPTGASIIAPVIPLPRATQGSKPTSEPPPQILGTPPMLPGPEIPIPTPDTEFIAQVTLSVYNIANQENILYIIAGILIAAAVLGWAISTIRNPPESG